MLISFLVIVGYDIWVYIEPTDGDTISAVTLDAAMTSTTVSWLIGFAIGFLMGHLFWPQHRDLKKGEGE